MVVYGPREYAMRRSGTLLGLLAACATLLASEKVYDLRGPGPRKGETFRSESVLHFKDSIVSLSVEGQVIRVKQSMTITSVEEERFLTVEGRQVIKSQTKVLKDHSKTVTHFMGEANTEEQEGALAGEVILSERQADGTWKHRLIDAQPTPEQKKELQKRVGPESDDELFPDKPVPVGHQWTVDAAKMQRFFGSSFSNLKGTVQQTFLRVEEFLGEPCAVIEAQGPVTGRMRDDEQDLRFEMDLKITTWRSLITGVDLKDQMTGKIRMTGKQALDGGVKADVVIEGKLSGSGQVRVIKSPDP